MWTKRTLCQQLGDLGVQPGDLLVVHSSFRALGWVLGGPVTLIDALLESVGPEGTLVMPTHTGDNSEPSHWKNPPAPESDWAQIRQETPAFDPARTPSYKMGVLPETFRCYPGVVRSDHPIGSFVALGPLAQTITEEHDLSEMFGDRTPLGAVYRNHGRVLLLGVGHDRNTSLHLAEFRAQWPGKRWIQEGARIRRNQRSEWVTFSMIPWDEDDFAELGAAFEEQHPARVGPVGNATARLLNQRALVDFGVGWMESHRR